MLSKNNDLATEEK